MKEKILEYFKDINFAYNDCTRFDTLKRMLGELEQEPCDNVCEWFEQYVDIATDIVELRFSDGTVKRAKRGLYMRDIEKSIRKMLIDQIANEKKTDTLDKIRAEIEAKCCITVGRENDAAITLHDVFEIIDKYKAETE